MSQHKKHPLPVLLYDSECVLCNRFKQALEHVSGAEILTMVSIHEDEIYNEFPFLSKEECHENLHIIDENGNIHIAGDAITYLTHKFPVVKNFAWLAETGMGKRAVDFFYQMANKYRQYSSKECEGCKKSRLR